MIIKKVYEYLIIKSSNLFEEGFYLNEYPDIRRSDVDPIWHYVSIGWMEGRNPSSDFNTNFYLASKFGPDQKKENPLIHYIYFGRKHKKNKRFSFLSGLTIIKGSRKVNIKQIIKNKTIQLITKVYKGIPINFRFRLRFWIESKFNKIFNELIKQKIKFSQSNVNLENFNENFLFDLSNIKKVKENFFSIAIHLHIFYYDLAGETINYLRNMPFEFDLYISVPDERIKKLCMELVSKVPLCKSVEVNISPNRGRDIGPFFYLFGKKLCQYNYIAHLHTKKSLHNKGTTYGWREYIFETLLGSKDQIIRIFSAFEQDDQIGMIYPQNFVRLPYWANTWLANTGLANQWRDRFGFSGLPEGYFEYPASSMFWARPAALKSIFDADLQAEDFPVEQGQNDGTLAHTLERMLAISTKHNGLKPMIIKDKTNPSWSTWRFDQYIQRDFFSLRDLFKVSSVKLIGFDVFDTLFTRPLISPKFIKEIIAVEAGNSLGSFFRDFRNVSEYHARLLHQKDVGLNEIYSMFKEKTKLSEDEIDYLKELEVRIEENLLKPRPDGIELYKEALESGKPVVILTDMFLPRTIIEKNLIKFGINRWSDLFVSSEEGIRKDTKELYNFVFKKYQITPEEFLMVGDNERSDLQIPSDIGAKYIHILRPVEMARGLPRFKPQVKRFEESSDLSEIITLGLVVQNNFSTMKFNKKFDPFTLFEPIPYNIGYSLIGPLLAGFSSWLMNLTLKEGVTQLFFLSREGKIMKDVFDCWSNGLLNKPVSKYMVISRRTASVAAIKNIDDIIEIAKTTYYPNHLNNFLMTRYGLKLSDSQWREVQSSIGWHSDTEISVNDKKIDHLIPLLQLIEDPIIDKAQIEKEALLNYLEHIGITNNEPSAVIDVGYGGTVQKYLNKLLDLKINGFYMMTDERSQIIANELGVKMEGCYYQNIDQSKTLPVMYKYNFDLEKLLSSTDPQLIFYEADLNGELHGVFKELEQVELEANPIREKIRAGALKFTEDAVEVRENILRSYKPSMEVAKSLMEEFLENRTGEEAELLSKIILDDYYCGRGLVDY